MNTYEEKISIIIPIFQAEMYLQDCLDSIESQTYDNLEVILIDDGSSDQSGNICDTMAAKDERFNVIHQKNQGVSAARNNGLNLCTGEYIMFVDADDWLEPTCCEHSLNRIKNTRSDICFFEMYINTSKEQKKTSALTKLMPILAEKGLKQKLLRSTIPFRNNDSEMDMVFYGPYCKLFKHQIISSTRFLTDLKYGEDALFCLEAIVNSDTFCFIDVGLYHYRRNSESVTASFKLDRIEQSILRLKYTDDFIQEKALYELADVFNEMFVNMCFWIINNVFVGKKLKFWQAWSRFYRLASDVTMQSIWRRIIKSTRQEQRALSLLFSGITVFNIILFFRLRYI